MSRLHNGIWVELEMRGRSSPTAWISDGAIKSLIDSVEQEILTGLIGQLDRTSPPCIAAKHLSITSHGTSVLSDFAIQTFKHYLCGLG